MKVNSKSLILIETIVLTAVVGLLDLNFGGTEVSFSICYLAPIALATWHLDRSAGFLVTVVSLLTRGWIDYSRLHLYSNSWIPLDNMIIRAVFFIGAVLALSRIRTLMERERRFGTIDFLTGIPNSRAFNDHVAREGSRCRRYGQPLTIAFMDCDNFKQVNDRWGHKAGDAVLRTIGATLQSQVRNSDFVARLGGDEFVFLLPDTDDEVALEVLTRVHGRLLEVMEIGKCDVTFSIGAITYPHPPESADDMLAQADTLMYSAKSQTKNQIKIKVIDVDLISK